VKIPIPVIAVVAYVISNRFTHSRIANLADAAGIKNNDRDFVGNKLDVVRFWLKCANVDTEPLSKLGAFILELMGVGYPDLRVECGSTITQTTFGAIFSAVRSKDDRSTPGL
jgi:hypothetical protein